jgi:hypothetical protein
MHFCTIQDFVALAREIDATTAASRPIVSARASHGSGTLLPGGRTLKFDCDPINRELATRRISAVASCVEMFPAISIGATTPVRLP